jgi:hypothetical protein
MTSIFHDRRGGLRSWRAHPSVTAIAVLTLSLGIGVNVVVFGLVELLILRPLPAVRSASRIAVTRRNPFSYQSFSTFAERQRSFDRIAALQGLTVSLFASGGAQPVNALFITPDDFPVLGVLPHRGRLLTRSDEGRPDRLAAPLSTRYAPVALL